MSFNSVNLSTQFKVFLLARPDENPVGVPFMHINTIIVDWKQNEDPLEHNDRALKKAHEMYPNHKSRIFVECCRRFNYSFYAKETPQMDIIRPVQLHLMKPANRAHVQKVTKATAAIDWINNHQPAKQITE